MRLNGASLHALDDEGLLEAVQRGTYAYFRDYAEPASLMARDRGTTDGRQSDHVVAVGGSGFAAIAHVVACARGWIDRPEALGRVERMVEFLEAADRFRGVYPHFLEGTSGRTIPFGPLDDGGDLVETSFLVMGLLCARAWFDEPGRRESRLRGRIDRLWHEVEWRRHERDDMLLWHWSPRHGWAMNHHIRGWNECLVTFVLATASPTHAIAPQTYHRGWAGGPEFLNGRSYYGTTLPLGPELGGPLFFAHYSFLGLDPRGLRDRYADYWAQNCAHVRINHAHCLANPHGHAGYGPACWGLTASDTEGGYAAHSPADDRGVISPTAALASFPYAPGLCMAALRHFLFEREGLWRDCGFVDAFRPATGWVADTHLAIDQGPIVAMIENHRSGLVWRLFMSCPEVRAGLARLDFVTGAAR